VLEVPKFFLVEEVARKVVVKVVAAIDANNYA
jgi:hypothetical protein